MNLGIETELIEFKESTGELHQAIESVVSILNKHGYGNFISVSKTMEKSKAKS